MDKSKLIDSIKKEKEKSGDNLIILAHHYQHEDIVDLSDFVGDSYKLALDCTKTPARFIVFCGVNFMAEGAELLSHKDQTVLIPEMSASCPMAEMINYLDAKRACSIISKACSTEIIPIVYINSYAGVKSLCGELGGAVCTSSNAHKIVSYFLKKGKTVFFMPDYNLGKNTANKLNIKENSVFTVKRDFTLKGTGDIDKAKMFLWDGYCYVHQNFTPDNIYSFRKKYPGGKVIVHPECPETVVNLSDFSGSTGNILNVTTESSEGSIWGIGTELMFIQRLARDIKNKKIIPIKESICTDMGKITLQSLYLSLKSITGHLENGDSLRYQVEVEEKYKENSKIALQRMIEITEGV